RSSSVYLSSLVSATPPSAVYTLSLHDALPICRGERAGVRNLQVRSPVNPGPLKGLEGKMDVVFIDAPCSGTGSWRRHPDTKWRLDRKSTRLNSSHRTISYAVFCLKKKTPYPSV